MIYRVLLDGSDILNYQEKPFILIGPSLTMELNTAGSFEFTLPPSHAFYDRVKPLASTIAIYEDETLLWFGRPVEIKTDFYRQKVVYCEGALAFFNDSVQRAHEYDRISLHAFFRTVIGNHNAQVGADRQFTVGSITVPDKTVYRKLNYDSTFDVLRRQCVNAEGGYLFLRTEGGVNYIDWFAEVPYASNQAVEFGLNMMDLSSVFDGSSIATCVIPLGETVEETGASLTVESVNNGSDLIESGAVAEYGRITKAVTFPGVTHPETLYEDGLEYLSATQFDNLTIECTAAELHWQNENYGLFRLGQKIRCRSVPHLLDRSFDLLKISLRLDTAEKRITLGTVKKETLTEITRKASDETEGIDQKIKEAVDSSLGDIEVQFEEINRRNEETEKALEQLRKKLGGINGIPTVDQFRDILSAWLDAAGVYIHSEEVGLTNAAAAGYDAAISTLRTALAGDRSYFDLQKTVLSMITFWAGVPVTPDSSEVYEELQQQLDGISTEIDVAASDEQGTAGDLKGLMGDISSYLNDEIGNQPSVSDFRSMLTAWTDEVRVFTETASPLPDGISADVAALYPLIQGCVTYDDLLTIPIPAMYEFLDTYSQYAEYDLAHGMTNFEAWEIRLDEIKAAISKAIGLSECMQQLDELEEQVDEQWPYTVENIPEEFGNLIEEIEVLIGGDDSQYSGWQDDLSSISDNIDRSDYSDYYSGSGGGSSGSSSSSGGGGSTGSGSSSGGSGYSSKVEIKNLEKAISDLQKRVDSLRDYNELMNSWETRVESRLTALEGATHWVHQINGATRETGTVNFVTEL